MLLHKTKTSVFDIQIHVPPRSFIRDELSIVLRGVLEEEEKKENALSDLNNVKIITTAQQALTETITISKSSDVEKDRLLHCFLEFADQVVEKLTLLGYWADYFEPTSGLLKNSPGQVIFPEVQVFQRLRGYQTSMAGNCHVILHPVWKHKVYPASLVTNAPENVIIHCITQIE